MPKQVIIPIPSRDFDPTEIAVPWKILSSAGIKIYFSTPDGVPGVCDQRMLTGQGLGIFSPLLRANQNARSCYEEMTISENFRNPLKWKDLKEGDFEGLLLPGGHAPGMKEYLESEILQSFVSRFFAAEKPVGAICHGVVLTVRSKRADGKSVLYSKKTTALLKSQELTAWALTCLWLGSYYRTYRITVEDEVKQGLTSSEDFLSGPIPLSRDQPSRLDYGFVVQDKNYVSARWPGDAHCFGNRFLELLK